MLVPTRNSAWLCVIASGPLSFPAGIVEFRESQAADAINAAPIVVFKIMQQFTTSIDPLDARAQGLQPSFNVLVASIDLTDVVDDRLAFC